MKSKVKTSKDSKAVSSDEKAITRLKNMISFLATLSHEQRHRIKDKISSNKKTQFSESAYIILIAASVAGMPDDEFTEIINRTSSKMATAESLSPASRPSSGTEKQHEVADILHPVLMSQNDYDILNAVPIRLIEIQSLIEVIQVSCESDNVDESFFKKHVWQALELLGIRFEDLSVLVKVIVDKQFKEQP